MDQSKIDHERQDQSNISGSVFEGSKYEVNYDQLGKEEQKRNENMDELMNDIDDLEYEVNEMMR